MRTSRIPTPPGSRFVAVHAWAIKRWGLAAAAVLGLLDFLDRANDQAGKPLASRARIIADLQGIVGRDSVDAALRALVHDRALRKIPTTLPGKKNLECHVDYALDIPGLHQILVTNGFRSPRSSGFQEPPELLKTGLKSGLESGVSSYKKEKEKEVAALHLRAPVADAAALTQKKRRVILGVVTWYPDDRLEVERLARLYGKNEVKSAADSIRARGSDPLPGRVEQELQHQAAAAKQAESHHDMCRALDERHAQQISAEPQAAAVGQKIIEKMRLKRLKNLKGVEL